MKIYSRIIGTGSYLPDQILTNNDLETIVHTTTDWIIERTGIEERRIAAPSETTCDLAEKASRQALETAGITPNDIDLIIVGTTTPDHIFPSVATQLQNRLGCYGCPAFDVQAVCTGFIYAIDIADRFIRTGAAQHALVVGADTLTRIINWYDRNTCIIFGDGAGAVVMKISEEAGIIDSRLYADGRYKELLWVPENFVEMRGSEVFKIAVNTLKEIADYILTTNNMTISELDWLIPHQANHRIISAIAKKLGFPEHKIINCVRKHGNTSAASVPLALDVAVRDGRINRGETILLEGFGSGFTWGVTLLVF